MRVLAWVCALALCAACGDDSSSDDAGSDGGTDAVTGCTSDDECTDGVFCNGAELCDPEDPRADADGCVTGAGDPCMDGRTCVEEMGACLTDCELDPDADGDGVDSAECGGTDCDDGDPERFPGATEVCDDDDEDCDPDTVGDTDADFDEAISAVCCNGDVCGTDCNDSAAAIFPGATEVCNGVDDDCDTISDEDLPTFSFVPDCDEDNFGGDGTPMVACGAPAGAPPSCDSGGAWVTTTGDCDDDDPSRNPGNTEVCNGIDDECDGDIDDIMDETVVCMAGETGACMNACGVPGTGTCAADCLGFDCSSELTEICNYCDDDGDGNFNEDALLAGFTATGEFYSCPSATSPVFGAAICDTADASPPSGRFVLEATLLDGTTNNQAGAVWFTPSDWVVGWGTIDVTVTLSARTVPTGGPMLAETVLGGWAVILGDGTPGVGSAANRGVPVNAGLVANWFWANAYLGCGPNPPPDAPDVFRLHHDFSPMRPPGSLASDWSCRSGDPVGSSALNSQTTFVDQTMRIRYTPDDPNTIPDEEEAIVTAGGSTITWRADQVDLPTINDELTPGSPLRIGITAGTYNQGGFDFAPGITFGVPVEAKVQIWRQTPNGGDPPTFDGFGATFSRGGICPP